MSKKLGVLYNASSGRKANSKADVQEAFKAHDMESSFFKIEDGINKITQAIKRQQIQLLVAAGGDGTVNLVANIAVKVGLPMAVLPLGTLNHFAKDMGLPMELEPAVKIIAKGKFTSVDYCTVNDHVFVNNSSIGMYPMTLLRREKLEPKLGKWLAAFLVAIQVSIKVSATHLELKLDQKKTTFKTSLVFIGNNSYEFDQVGFANRQSLSGGSIFLYVMRANRFTALLRATILAFLGNRYRSRDYLESALHTIEINSHKKVLNVAIDGEVVSLNTPLSYKIHARSLKVCIP